MNIFIRIFSKSFLPAAILLSCLPSMIHAGQPEQDQDIGISSSGQLKITNIYADDQRIGLYEKYEITFTMTGEWLNPFDPEDIRADAIVTLPGGGKHVVPAFFFQEYVKGPENSITATGDPVWKVRYSPSAEGEYSVVIAARNKQDKVYSDTLRFSATDYKVSHGYLKISKTNPLYFEFDDGTPFFAVAVDNAVSSCSKYMRYYPRFASAGGNYNRLFIMSGDLDLGEEVRRNAGPGRGLGMINLDAAWKLDRVIETGELLGIYHQMCMTNQYNFNLGWKYNAFNKANGGILDSPKEYFTSEASMKILENRFRYIIARWGYSTSVFSWNLWNEYSAQPGFNIPDAVAWHRRMAEFVRQTDPFGHVIHTNDGRLNGVDEISGMKEMEIVSTNTYGIKNIADLSWVWTRKFITRYNKPYMLAEYGIGHSNLPKGGYGEVDPEKRMVHDGFWGPLAAGSAGTGMPWEWQWLDNGIVFTYLKAVAKTVKDIPFSRYQWEPVQVASFSFKGQSSLHYGDVIAEGWNPTGNYGMPPEAADHKIFSIGPDGKVSNNEYLNSPLADTSGRRSPGRGTSVSFEVSYPVNGEFVIYASDVRPTGKEVRLRVSVDGQKILEAGMAALPFLKHYPVKVPEGRHVITVENAGGGTFQTAFELRNYVPRTGPDLEVRGLKCDDHMILWIKNQKYTLLHELAHVPFLQQDEGILELDDIAAGTWVAEWINTVNSLTIRNELVESNGSRLVLNTPVTGESIAVKLKRIR